MIAFKKVLDMAKHFEYKNKIPSIILYTFLSVGCFWQIYTICEMFFNYPTNIQIETNFNQMDKTLPAMTLCANIGNNAKGRTSKVVLENMPIKDIFQSMTIDGEHIKDYYIMNSIEFVSYKYYC